MAELEYVAAIGASEPETADNCRFESYQTHIHEDATVASWSPKPIIRVRLLILVLVSMIILGKD